MSYNKVLFLLLLLVCLMCASFGQDCNGEGFECAEHAHCCGGCCFDGECYDTYRNCYDTLAVCKDHICIGDETCLAFSPPQCPGCEPIPMCI